MSRNIKKGIIIAACIIVIEIIFYPFLIIWIDYNAALKMKETHLEQLEGSNMEIVSAKLVPIIEYQKEYGRSIFYGVTLTVIVKAECWEDISDACNNTCCAYPVELKDFKYDKRSVSYVHKSLRNTKLPEDRTGYYALLFMHKVPVNESSGLFFHGWMFPE